MRTVLIAVCAIAAAGLAQAQDQIPPEKAIIVLDASGSMWGQIEGEPKIAIARSVMDDLLSDLEASNASLELGLIAYGHNRKGDCEDIETLIEPGPVERSLFLTAANGLNPKGMTPLTASVQKAAETLRFEENKATVILVTDGLETCDADPCAAAESLGQAGIDFTTHVIGFDVSEEDAGSLRCMAEATGGAYLTADTADELTSALKETVTAAAKPAGPEPGLRLSAIWVEGGEPITDRTILWQVLEPEEALDGSRREIDREAHSISEFELEPGDYRISATLGAVRRTADITLEDSAFLDHVMVMDAGELRLNPVVSEGGPAVERDVFFRVLEPEENLDGERAEIDREVSRNPLFVLPAGDYVIAATYGAAEMNDETSVTAGELTEQTINLNAGYVRVNAVLADGGEPVTQDLSWRVLEGGEYPSGDRAVIDREVNDATVFIVGAGNYVLAAELDAAFAQEPVSVEAGASISKTIDLNAARIRLTARRNGEDVTRDLFWHVLETGEDGREVARQVDDSPTFTLSAGEYYVIAEQGSERTESESFTLEAGEERRIYVDVD